MVFIGRRPVAQTTHARRYLTSSLGSSVSAPNSQVIFGFTPLPDPGPLDRAIYVSDSVGLDSNSGTISSPLKTIAAGKALMRDLYGDQMYLRRGDTWASQSLGTWTISGASSIRPLVVRAYGSGARPIIQTGSTYLIYKSGANVSNLILDSLEATADQYVGTANLNGIGIFDSADNLLFQNNYIHNYAYCHVFQGNATRQRNIRVIGGCAADAWYNDALQGVNCQGVYAQQVDGLHILGVCFDMCGWNSTLGGSSADNGLRRAVYLQNGTDGCTDTHVDHCFALRTDGFQCRNGGSVTWNVLSRVKTGITVGYGYDPDPAGIAFDVSFNSILESQASTYPEALLGINITNVTAASTLQYNIVAQTLGTEGTDDIRALWIRAAYENGTHWPIIQAKVYAANNIFYRAGSLYDGFNNSGQFTGGVLVWNDNYFESTDQPYGDPPFNFGQSYFTDIVFGARNGWYVSGVNEDHWFYDAAQGYYADTAAFSAAIGDTAYENTQRDYVDPTRSLGTWYTSLGHAPLSTLTLQHDAMCLLLRAQDRDNGYDPQLTAASFRQYLAGGFALSGLYGHA
jgi:hypothetical protein